MRKVLPTVLAAHPARPRVTAVELRVLLLRMLRMLRVVRVQAVKRAAPAAAVALAQHSIGGGGVVRRRLRVCVCGGRCGAMELRR